MFDAAADCESTHAGFVRDFNHLAVDKSSTYAGVRLNSILINFCIGIMHLHVKIVQVIYIHAYINA